MVVSQYNLLQRMIRQFSLQLYGLLGRSYQLRKFYAYSATSDLVLTGPQLPNDKFASNN